MGPEKRGSNSQRAWELPDELEKTIEADVLPRLLMAHRVGAVSPEKLAEASNSLGAAEVERLVELLRHAPDAEAGLFVEMLMELGTSSEAIYLDLLAPAARRLGVLWDEDECDFLEVSVALGRIQRILRGLSQLTLGPFEPQAATARILLCGAPGEQHTLGMFMVAEFFVRDGWLVTIGAPFTDEDLGAILRHQWFDVVGFSVGCDTRLGQVRREIGRVRRISCNQRVLVLVGGRLLTTQPNLVERLGADGTAADAREAPRTAASMLARAGLSST